MRLAIVRRARIQFLTEALIFKVIKIYMLKSLIPTLMIKILISRTKGWDTNENAPTLKAGVFDTKFAYIFKGSGAQVLHIHHPQY